jgi:hypothetical protein
VLLALTTTPNGDGTVTEGGKVRNDGKRRAAAVGVARTWYGARGEVLGARFTATSPAALGAGATGRFTIVRPALAGVQAARTQLRGS